MNRRLRLALLLAALAATGPPVSAPQSFDATRVSVSISWFRVATASRPQVELEQAGLKARTYRALETPGQSCTEPDVVIPDPLRVHSLFQRPPPLSS